MARVGEHEVPVDVPDLLHKTSRTFALSIPLLRDPLRGEVAIAYLLFRIVDTFEDSTDWDQDTRVAALTEFSKLMESLDFEEAERAAARWVSPPPLAHDGYLELLHATPGVLKVFRSLAEPARAAIRTKLRATTLGMSDFVRRMDGRGNLLLRDGKDLRQYCYIVAGLVGEMLTELFLAREPCMQEKAEIFRTRARAFGEGLQLVNIVKDAHSDATEGRRYLPRNLPLEQVFDWARQDLDRAVEYVLALQKCGASRGLVAFNALNTALARATLTRVEEQGAGAKLGRPEVFAILQEMNRAIDAGEPAIS